MISKHRIVTLAFLCGDNKVNPDTYSTRAEKVYLITLVDFNIKNKNAKGLENE